ncbi:Pumilio y domain family member 4 [Madurella mycetomatis]|uniref:Pumilio y domain family member 4 n=1 Tax=Madurella mycetomatis TaxID=100816 RepID=A0A175VT76_9PEZI|nr:Pumilio y domain family member 4 [Madurella mycetomatis]
MDDFFRTQQSPRGEAQVSAAFVSPPRNGPLLPRRFTTDSGRVPTLSSITPIPLAPEPQDFASTTTRHKVQLLEKKRLDYERLREHKRRFEAEIHKLDAQQRQEERELQQMQEDINARYGGHQSEPTTPPEYREASGFPSIFSRPNRYSTSSLTSPQGIFNRPARSGSLLTSPLSGTLPSRFAFDDQLPSRSVPGSRRNSDEDEKEEAVRQDPTSHRSTNALNRYSMPVTRSRTYLSDIGLEDSNNTTGFLFGDEDSNTGETRTTPTAQVGNNDTFPSLFRQQAYSSMVSLPFSSRGFCLVAADSGPPNSSADSWVSVNKHQQQQSMSTIGSTQLNGTAPVGSPSEASTIGSRPSNVRHSIDGMKFFPETTTATSDAPAPSIVSPPTTHILASPPKLQQSYSANDVPTVKTNGPSGLSANANNHAQQHFHNHNASLGRIPAGAVPNRHSRELSTDASLASAREPAGYPSISSTLQASAPPFGPATAQPQSSSTSAPALTTPTPAMPYPFYPPPAGYNPMNGAPTGYNALPMLMQNMSVSNGNPSAMYPQQNFTGYGPLYNPAPAPRQAQDSQARVIQSRRQMDSEAMARFNNLPLEQVGGTIYTLCKDQHGCRYLQKQLENRIPDQVHMIWLETNQHVVELMTDPFGNYLCQKLLEYCSDDERTVLIQNASADMVRIALNQHGTRALQKMIEHVTTPVQVNLIIEALRHQVVELIQDLNGNHVIQKCLNKLSATDATFIFDAVGKNCVEVGTHRHGCCVLQRCIDHADGAQKVWLIECITAHAVTLVQDPFGNYVVQYIIDLNEESFTEPLVRQFQGRIIALSKHKFSSNVVEKCLRCASEQSRDMIVSELLTAGEIERLLRDSFANYVVQTALDYATPVMKHRLVETIRPCLPSIRATPYGRRIQAKIQTYDTRTGPNSNGQVTPSDPSGGQVAMRSSHNRAMSNTSILATGAYANGVNGTGVNGTRSAVAAFPSSGMVAVPPPQAQAPPQPPRAQQFPPQFSMGAAAENGETQWL